MNASERIPMLLALIAEQCGEAVSESRLEFLLSRLDGLDAAKLEKALENLADSCRRFPTVAEIKAAMGQSEATARDKALLVADRILAGIAKIGEIPPGNVKTAQSVPHVIGETAYQVVQSMGGWNHVVGLAQDTSIFRAQVRDLVEAGFRTGRFEGEPLEESQMSLHQALGAVEYEHERLESGDNEWMQLANTFLNARKGRG